MGHRDIFQATRRSRCLNLRRCVKRLPLQTKLAGMAKKKEHKDKMHFWKPLLIEKMWQEHLCLGYWDLLIVYTCLQFKQCLIGVFALKWQLCSFIMITIKWREKLISQTCSTSLICFKSTPFYCDEWHFDDNLSQVFAPVPCVLIL